MSNETTAAPPTTGFLFWDLMLGMRAQQRDLALYGAGARPAEAKGVAGGEAVIPLAEEVLNVEKRTVSGGTTRVRRYVVETPVERRVTLRNETVVVERRKPVAVDATTGDTLVEKTVEATDTSEVPVVWKSVRLREEVVLRVESSERSETVRDTVRHDEVEIERRDEATTPAPRRGGAKA